MDTSVIVNLRAAGTDAANPTGGVLVGTTTITNLPDERFPDDLTWLAPILSCNGRIFKIASSGFQFGGNATPEYVEIVPVICEAKFA